MPPVKRLLTGAVGALALVASGALASACTVTPTAASVGDASISTATLNSQLHTVETTSAGGCLFQLEVSGANAVAPQGDGGSGTYSIEFANRILNVQVGNLLAQQYAASLGITITPADLSTAQSDFESTLDGEISQQVEDAQSAGTVSYCEQSSGQNLTGAELLAGLPASLRQAEIHNQAIDEKLLARGAALSPAAIDRFYQANLDQFTGVCVSQIATKTQAQAQAVVAQLQGGASFAALAKSESIDIQNSANGGSLGCDFTRSEVEQQLEVSTITVGKPLAPIENTSTGQWLVFEVTNQTVEPVSAAATVIRQELLQATANVNRVSRELVRFARTTDVSVNPQYGTWQGLTIVPPVGPPERFLLAGASGAGATTGSTSLGVGSATSGG
jgi:parvulin-like peptidyl-prolyl isomerase